MSEFNAKGDILMEHLRLKADGKQVVTLLKEFNHAALDAIASVRNLIKTFISINFN